MRGDEGPRSLEALAVEPEGQAAVLFLLEQLVRSAVPDLHGPRAVLPLWDLALERSVLERVVFDVDREVLLAGLERHAFRHRPARQCAIAFEAQVVVKCPRLVALDDEDRPLPDLLSPLRSLAVRLGRLSRSSFAPIVTKLVA